MRADLEKGLDDIIDGRVESVKLYSDLYNSFKKQVRKKEVKVNAVKLWKLEQAYEILLEVCSEYRIDLLFHDFNEPDKRVLQNYTPGDTVRPLGKRLFLGRSTVGNVLKKLRSYNYTIEELKTLLIDSGRLEGSNENGTCVQPEVDENPS